ncbi:hypothetical protein [Nocardia sp. NPDC059691]|uniref:hypothetical protein n=1 Tax=Nocardia sp. NPDC059691 TaxID=3346908 RepID=UPI00368C476A
MAVVDDSGKVGTRAHVGVDTFGFAQLLEPLAQAGDGPIPVEVENDCGRRRPRCA